MAVVSKQYSKSTLFILLCDSGGGDGGGCPQASSSAGIWSAVAVIGLMVTLHTRKRRHDPDDENNFDGSRQLRHGVTLQWIADGEEALHDYYHYY
ncbi:hypothetical protein TYRP_005626 [Tyrophagus putrescentiae]|nr:hypothetical protein TYRP_005626 [Tyrophagus putrescentiae]